MTDTARYPLVLGLISVCSAAALAFTYVLTRDEIRRQAELERDRGIAKVFGITLKDDDPRRPWDVLGDPARPVYKAAGAEPLYAAQAGSRGYRGPVEVIVAVDQRIAERPEAARIKGVTVVGQQETPGLGDKCKADDFQKQFANLLVDKLELMKNQAYRDPQEPGSEALGVAAITGATITSTAVINAVRDALDLIRERAGPGPKGKEPAPKQ